MACADLVALNVECEGQHACLRSCEGPTAEPFVNELARLYASFRREDSADVSVLPPTQVLY
jgi:hypothetical protein